MVDNRKSERRKACIQAFVADADDAFDVKCVIRDVSKTGCKLVSGQLHELPDRIQLIPEGFKTPLAARIVWRNGRVAGLQFEAPVSGDIGDACLDETRNVGSDEAFDLGVKAPSLGYKERLQRYRPPKRD